MLNDFKKVTSVTTTSKCLVISIEVLSVNTEDGIPVRKSLDTIDLPFELLPPALCYQIAGSISGANGYYNPDASRNAESRKL